MGDTKPPHPVKLLVGLLAARPEWLDQAEELLAADFGPIDLASGLFPFDFTDYYAPEMGPGLLRKFVTHDRLISPEDLAAIKLRTNALEADLAAAILASGLAPPASGLAPPASGLAPPASGLAPPASGLAPPASGLAPAASGLAPPASGLAPAASGLAPPASGLRPLPSGLAPPASGLRPPPSGLAPPASGLVKRPVNLDPGLLDGSKLILATTKDYAHRIYLSRGIYAEVTLTWRRGAFQPTPWTYRDYRTEPYLAFFAKARARFLDQLRSARPIGPMGPIGPISPGGAAT